MIEAMAQGSEQDGEQHDDGTDWGGRLPLLDPASLTEEQRKRYDTLVETSVPWAERAGFRARLDDGRLIGPFNGFLHAPELATGYARWIAAETRYTSLSAQLREVVILPVGVAWEAAYEIYAHVAVARSVGLDERVIDAVRAGTTTDDFTAEQAAAHDYTRALATDRRVDDATYRRAVNVLGQRSVIDMTHLAGIYLATSALLNAFEVPAPEIPDPS
jgi:4-carboxymuconolactone decarboxylase